MARGHLVLEQAIDQIRRGSQYRRDPDEDLDELCGTLESLENAVAVLGSIFPLERGKLKTGKRAQKLIAACRRSPAPDRTEGTLSDSRSGRSRRFSLTSGGAPFVAAAPKSPRATSTS